MRLLPVIAAALLIGSPSSAAAQAAALGGEPIQTPCFEPDDDCIGVLVAEIAAAEREILVMAYGFTDQSVAEALSDAARRGVTVRMIVDRRRNTSGLMTRLPDAGVQLLTDSADIQHNKVMIFDRRRLATGSQNFTRGSRNNAENLLLIDHAGTVAAYVENWMRRAARARPFIAPEAD